MNEQEFALLMHKFRFEPATPLQFQPCIELLIDGDFCKGIDKIIHEAGTTWERRIAVESLGTSLPDERGLYMFVWRPELTFRFSAAPQTERPCWALYVGKAGTEDGTKDTIRQRYLSEYSKYVGRDASCLWDAKDAVERHDRLARYLTLRPLEYWFLPMLNVRDIGLLERKIIKLLNPPLNRQHGVKIKPGKTVPAFEEPKDEQ